MGCPTRAHGPTGEDDATKACACAPVYLGYQNCASGVSCIARAIPSSHAGGGHVAISISTSTETLTAKRKATIKATLGDIIAALRDRI